jgi:protease-4
MKQFLLTMAGVFAGLVLFFIGVPLVLLSMVAGAAKPQATPAAAVLSLDLRKGLTDQDSGGLTLFKGSTTSVMSVVRTLRRAETDSHIKGLFVRLPEGGISPGEADELRLAFQHFRAAGKPIIAHSQGLYPSGAITSTYMLGAAATQFWMQPGAPFQAVGLASEDIFFKRFFDKYGVQPQFEQRGQYKNAVNGYLYNDYTPAHRQAELSWMGSIYDSAIKAAAADRKTDPAGLKATLEAGPYDAGDALAKGLIDKLGQVRDAQVAAINQAGSGARMEALESYAESTVSDGMGLPVVAVVNAEGDIATGPPTESLSGGEGINSDAVSNALYAAARDNSVKAIVLRLSSPGGSDTASEQILAAVRAAKEKKPVVVSMGAYGASGGYWVSSQASAIVAEPTTLTGSIGVFGGKFVVGPALSKFGVDMRQISVGGDYAGADGSSAPFTPRQRQVFAAAIDKVYDGFIERVATGRKMTPERVRELAQGRVWTGAQAKDLGLVDEVGGFYTAVDKAKALAGITGEVRLKTVNGPRSPFAFLGRAVGADAATLNSLASLRGLLSDPNAVAVLRQLNEARVRANGGGVALADLPRF